MPWFPLKTIDMEDGLLKKIRSFIYDGGWRYTLPFPLSFNKKEISREIKLVSDLKITGDDADNFFLAFAKSLMLM